ncbi:hypothetical protein FAI41_04835 [Acetobacteraceae bacterium]|nr:hypothetical protein FAI41_04835 [Acetobacteraceae bacterium]
MSVNKDSDEYLEKSEAIEIARQAYLHREDIQVYEQEMLALKRLQIDAMERTIYWQRLHMCAVLLLAFVLFFWLGFVLVKFIPTASF